MSDAAATAVTTAERHTRRLAYNTADNPFLRSVACTSLSDDQRETLGDLMRGRKASERALRRIVDGAFKLPTVGVVPRDLGQGKTSTGSMLAATSLNAFADMALPWWVISHLWCQEVGRKVDAALPVVLTGDRLHPRYRDKPRSTGQMFRSAGEVESELGRVVTKAVASGDRPLSAVVFDLKSFFYSVTSSPTDILAAAGFDGVILPRGRRLTRLLDVLHEHVADELARLAPRGTGPEIGVKPLPVGLPSSRVLANAVVGIVVDDLLAVDSCVAAGAYVDDLVVVTDQLPAPEDHPNAFLKEQGFIESDDENSSFRLRSLHGAKVAHLVVSHAKSRFAWGRVIKADDLVDEAEATVSDDKLNPGDMPDPDDAEAGPYATESEPEDDKLPRPLLAVIEAPPPPLRVPGPLRHDLKRLTDEIRVGIDVADANKALGKIVKADSLTRLQLRPHWDELLACTYYADGPATVVQLVANLSATIDSLEAPVGASDELRTVMHAGIRHSLAQSAAEALAAAVGSKSPLRHMDRAALSVALGVPARQLSVATRSVRASRFVRRELVSAPMAEFTDWQGPLFGDVAYRRFSRWAIARGRNTIAAQLPVGVDEANRFVHLHEVCMAVHLWAPNSSWKIQVFSVFKNQPLIDAALVTDIRSRVREALSASSTDVPPTTRLTIAIPSVGVAEEQLNWAVRGKRIEMSRVARASRQTVMRTMLDAVKLGADAIVYPEWSLPTRQLPWLLEQSAKAQLLVVGGEQPRLAAGAYSNRVWTGIPLVDAQGHRLCVVPPPREKRYLNAAEDSARRHNSHMPSRDEVPVYQWRGIRFASLICFEFADAEVRSRLRPVVDVLTVSSLNRDWKYFQAVQEATTRDNYCITVCVNTSQYPGTHIMRPVSSEKAVALSLHGATGAAVVIKEVDPSPVVLARRTGKSPRDRNFPGAAPTDDLELRDYKPLPPTLR